MNRHREPLAATVAAAAIFVGIVAPAIMLVLAVMVVAICVGVLVFSASSDIGTDGRRSMQNPR